MKFKPNKVKYPNPNTQTQEIFNQLMTLLGNEEIPSNYIPLLAEGFPPHMIAGFLNMTEIGSGTTIFHKCIVMSRVSGFMTYRLILEGYSAKGFHVKSKSCDWGPMAGFVCHLPLLNKKGYGKNGGNAIFNFEKHLDYLIYLEKEKKTSPFQQIIISEARKLDIDQIKTKENKSFKLNHISESTNKNQMYGWSQNGKDDDSSTVRMEFLLIKEDNSKPSYWKLFHGDIQFKEPKSDKWQNYEGISTNVYNNVTVQPKDSITQIKIDELRKKIADYDTSAEVTLDTSITRFTMGDQGSFYPINGVVNVEDIGKEKDGLHTVTGDYDLFALWPLKAKSNDELLTRLTEKNCHNIPQRAYKFFNKPFTYKIKRNNKLEIWIEFIPDGNHIKDFKLEDFDKGNMNELTKIIVILFNQYIKNSANKLEFLNTANNVIHSDEGGRPNVKDIDLPIAVFHPSKFGKILESHQEVLRAGLITTPLEFLNYLNLRDKYFNDLDEKEKVNNKHPIILNYGWLMHLLVLSMSENEVTSFTFDKPENNTKFQKYVKIRKSEIDNPQIQTAKFKTGLQKLLEFDDNSFIDYRRKFILAFYTDPSYDRKLKLDFLLLQTYFTQT